MDANVLFYDKSIAVCVKPSGVVSEGDGLPRLLRERLGGEIFPVHRLDKDVGGVMVYARTASAAAKLSAAIAAKEMEKEYLAVVEGRPEPPDGVFFDLLFHDRGRNKTYVTDRKRAGVKEAELEYTLLQEKDGLSLVRVKLHTGRSHQIRVQFASRKMPIVGDRKYGSRNRDIGIALFAFRLGFDHPVTGEKMCFSALPPEDLPWTEFAINLEGSENGKGL